MLYVTVTQIKLQVSNLLTLTKISFECNFTFSGELIYCLKSMVDRLSQAQNKFLIVKKCRAASAVLQIIESGWHHDKLPVLL